MKYEYKIINTPHESALNLLGKDGWELVSVVSNGIAGRTAFLKREYIKKEKSDPVQQMILEEEEVKKDVKKTTKSNKKRGS